MPWVCSGQKVNAQWTIRSQNLSSASVIATHVRERIIGEEVAAMTFQNKNHYSIHSSWSIVNPANLDQPNLKKKGEKLGEVWPLHLRFFNFRHFERETNVKISVNKLSPVLYHEIPRFWDTFFASRFHVNHYHMLVFTMIRRRDAWSWRGCKKLAYGLQTERAFAPSVGIF